MPGFVVTCLQIVMPFCNCKFLIVSFALFILVIIYFKLLVVSVSISISYN